MNHTGKVSQPGPLSGVLAAAPCPALGASPLALPPGLLWPWVRTSCELAEALLEGGHDTVLNAEDDEGVVAARGFLFQQPARQHRGGLARGRSGLSPPRLTVALGQPAPAGV